MNWWKGCVVHYTEMQQGFRDTKRNSSQYYTNQFMIFRCLCFTVSRTIQCSISESPLNFLLNSVSVSRYASFFLGLGLGVPCLFQNSSTYVLFFQGLFLNMLSYFLVFFQISFDFSTGPGLGMLCSFYNCSHVYFILSRSVLRYALFSIGMQFFRLLKKDLSLYLNENVEINQENYFVSQNFIGKKFKIAGRKNK